MNCRSCRWFEDAWGYFDSNIEEVDQIVEDASLASDPHEYGFCRRHAPRPHDGNHIEDVTWPLVWEGDWCGEFIEKKDATDGTQG
jgi:hypothetical protein